MSSSLKKVDSAIKSLCVAAVKIKSSQPAALSSVLQEANAYINVINSFLSMPSRLDELSTAHGVLPKSQHFNELLECIPPLLLKLISGMPF